MAARRRSRWPGRLGPERGLALAAAVLLSFASAAQAAVTERVSISSASEQANSPSFSRAPAVNSDGRLVAFQSDASNLVPGDTNGTNDVFVRDRQTGRTERVSVSSAGVQGNGSSEQPSLSADGRFVAFHSDASNLVPGDANGRFDVFVHDRHTGATELVSLVSTDSQNIIDSFDAAISADGRFVAFSSGSGDSNVFVRDRGTGTTQQVNVSSTGEPADPPSFSGEAAISADGRFAAFESLAPNLVPQDDGALEFDVFVRDTRGRTTERVSVSSDPPGSNHSQGPAISADGRFLTFSSFATDLVPGDTNFTYDVFVRDRRAGATERVSVSSAGGEANGASFSGGAALGADGRLVAFTSFASNLVPGDTNSPSEAEVFVRDRGAGTTQRASVDSAGGQADGASFEEAISADGRVVAFASVASNLVPNDTNGAPDIFVRDRGPGRTPGDQLRDLIRTVAGLGLAHGTEQSLTAKLRRALAAAEDNRPATDPCSALHAFGNQVRAQSDKKLTSEQAARLLADAGAIQAAFGCSSRR